MSAGKKNIVFVCTGNTCRSPMAENIFKYVLKKMGKLDLYNVSSAGLSIVPGQMTAEHAIVALNEIGIKVRAKKAKPLSIQIFDKADFVICMTKAHKSSLRDNPKIFSIGEITGGNDVSDPYGGNNEDYKRTAEHLLYAMTDIIEFLDKSPNK